MSQPTNKQALPAVREMPFFSGIRDFTVKSDLGYSINSDIQLLGGVGSTIHPVYPRSFVIRDKLTKQSRVQSGYSFGPQQYQLSRVVVLCRSQPKYWKPIETELRNPHQYFQLNNKKPTLSHNQGYQLVI